MSADEAMRWGIVKEVYKGSKEWRWRGFDGAGKGGCEVVGREVLRWYLLRSRRL